MRPQRKKSSGPALSIIVIVVLAGAAISYWTVNRRPQMRSIPAVPQAATMATNTPTNSVSTTTNTQPVFRSQAEVVQWAKHETNTTDLVNRGAELLAAGAFREAVICLYRAVELKPEDEDATFNLAFAYAKAGYPEQAIKYYNRSIEIFPEYADAHHNLANLLLQQKRYDEAIEHFTAALKSTPEHALAHNGLGRALAEQGKVREALPHFSEATRLDPSNVETKFNLGSAFLALGRTNDAASQFREVLRLRPEFVPAQQALKRIERVQ